MPPSYLQPSTRRAAPLAPGTSPTSPEYAQNLVDRYAIQTEPTFKQSKRDWRADVRSSRGLGDSGIEAMGNLGLKQGRSAELGAFAGQVGQHQADLGETERVRQMLRGWNVEDRDVARGDRRMEREAAEGGQQAQLWGDIMAAAGQMVGGPLLSRLFSGGNQKMPYDSPRMASWEIDPLNFPEPPMLPPPAIY